MEPALSTPETAPTADGSEQIPAEFAYFEKVGPAIVRVRQHGKPERLRRAAKAWAGCWGAAIVAVFLPVLHFILVPSLLVGGPLYAMVMMREKVTVLGADGNCPACGTMQHPRPKAGASAKMPFRCESCRREVELRLPAELLT